MPPDRGTIGSGRLDDEALVELDSRVTTHRDAPHRAASARSHRHRAVGPVPAWRRGHLLARFPGFVVAGANARHRITGRLTAVGQVQNLFNADYSTFGVLGNAELLGEAYADEPRFYSPGAPRAAWVGIEVTF